MNGTLPLEMRELSQIQQLILPGMALRGSINNIFSTWSNLETLDLNSNQLEGIIPNTMNVDNPLLSSLDLSENQFNSTIPDTLGYMALSSLQLGSNLLVGQIPSTFSNLTNAGEFVCCVM